MYCRDKRRRHGGGITVHPIHKGNIQPSVFVLVRSDSKRTKTMRITFKQIQRVKVFVHMQATKSLIWDFQKNSLNVTGIGRLTFLGPFENPNLQALILRPYRNRVSYCR